MVARRMPSHGFKACADKLDGIKGRNGHFLRVRVVNDYNEGTIVTPINRPNWTAEGIERFKFVYGFMGTEDGGFKGYENHRLKKMQTITTETIPADVVAIAATEEDFDEDDEEDEFKEFEHNGTKYYRDEDGSLYTIDGDYWGYVTESGDVIKGDRDFDEPVVEPVVRPEVVVPTSFENNSGECKSNMAVERKSKGGNHFKNYTEKEDKIITDYMIESHIEYKNGVPREIFLAKKMRILASIPELNGRKPQNIQTRWERYLHPKYLTDKINQQKDEIQRLKDFIRQNI